MRADRLVAIVLLLQVHGRMTAADIAERLETSERTIRRDLDSLCVAGVPVYPQRGRGGGWALLGGHRIDLTGLTADEAQALLLATDSGTGTLGPGFADGLAAARRKLLAALPEGLRERVEAAAGAVLVDRTRWGRPPGAGPEPPRVAPAPGEPAHLAALRRAVLAACQVVVVYEPPGRPAEERRLHPLGLVCKRDVWYLVALAPAGLRTYRLSRMISVELTDDPVEQPAGFDLAEAWAGVQQSLSERMATPVGVEARVSPTGLRRLRATVGAWWPLEVVDEGDPGAGGDPGGGADRRSGGGGGDRRAGGEPTDGGWATVRIRFPAVWLAASELMSMGDQLEVLSPPEVRAALAERGRRLVERYGGAAAPVPSGVEE